MAKLHLGLTPWDFSEMTAANLSAQAQFAEACGYDSIWLPENHFAEHALPDPLTLLAAVAGATSRLRLGTTSYLLTLRHPLQAAEQVAVLDQLCEGRLILGVGRGYAPEMLRAFRVPQKEKRRIFAWTLELMRRAWAGEAVSVNAEGEDVVFVHPRPRQTPEPPIWVAAFGPKALSQAGRLGLPYLCSPMESMRTLERNYAQHRAAAEAAELTLPDVVPVMRTVFVSRDRNVLAELRDAMTGQVDNARLEAGETVDDWAIIGEPEYVHERIETYRHRLGMTHLIATRLRIGGVPETALRASVASLAELVDRA